MSCSRENASKPRERGGLTDGGPHQYRAGGHIRRYLQRHGAGAGQLCRQAPVLRGNGALQGRRNAQPDVPDLRGHHKGQLRRREGLSRQYLLQQPLHHKRLLGHGAHRHRHGVRVRDRGGGPQDVRFRRKGAAVPGPDPDRAAAHHLPDPRHERHHGHRPQLDQCAHAADQLCVQ